MPIIEHVLRRLDRCGVFGAGIVLATTNRPCDIPLAERFAAMGGRVYLAGESEVTNVAKRFVSAAKFLGAEYALRANGDSPFPDSWLIGQGVGVMQTQAADIVTNLLPRTYPYGVSLEVVRVAALEGALPNLSVAQKEHVTACFYDQPEKFNIAVVQSCPWALSDIRFTIDDPHELATLERVIDFLPCPVVDANISMLLAAAAAARAQLSSLNT